MKKTLVTIAALAACVSAFAQGKVIFGNDAAHLITLTATGSQLPAAWSSLAGLAVPQIGGVNAQNMGLLTIDLQVATTAAGITDALAPFRSITTGGPALPDGRWTGASTTLTGFPSGVPTFFRVRAWETAAGSWANASAGAGGAWLFGESPVFSAVPGGAAPNPIYSHLANGANSTWTDAPIVLAAVPEPSTFALAGLGAAAMLIFRRRK